MGNFYVIKKLEGAGFIKSYTNKKDVRRIYLKLTSKGRLVANHLNKLAEILT